MKSASNSFLASLFTRMFCVVCALLFCSNISSEVVQEYQVKAAYLVNFPKIVRWPEAAFQNLDSPFNFCLLDGEKISETVKDTIHNDTVNGRKVVVHTGSSVLAQCHIIFIGSDRKDLATLVFSTVEGRDVLTVGDFSEFSDSGGMITFFTKDSRVNIAIDLAAVIDTNLKLSVKLIKIAKINF